MTTPAAATTAGKSDLSFKHAAQQLCTATHPDDLIDACRSLCHKDYTGGSASGAVRRAVRLVVLPRLLDMLSSPPPKRPADSENWVTFWAMRTVGEVVMEGMERDTIGSGAVDVVLKYVDEGRGEPETLCVALKVITILSAGFSASEEDGTKETDGGEQDVVVGDFGAVLKKAIDAVIVVIEQEKRKRRVDRHPFVNPLAVYALAYLTANAPATSGGADFEAISRTFGEIVEEGDKELGESVLVASEALLRATGTNVSGLVSRVLWRMGRGDYQGGAEMADSCLSFMKTVVSSLGLGYLSANHGMRAMSHTMSDLRTSDHQQSALKLAADLISAGQLSAAVGDGLIVQTFLLLTEVPDLPTRQAALDLLDSSIRTADASTFNAMHIDTYFVLSLLALAKASPDQAVVKFGRQIVALVMWMGKEGRVDMEQVCAVGNYETASRITNGMGAMMLANTVSSRLKEERAKGTASVAASVVKKEEPSQLSPETTSTA